MALLYDNQARTSLAKNESIAPTMETMIPNAFAEAGKIGLPPAGPLLSAYFTWDSKEGGETRFTCGPSVAGGSPEAEGDGFGVRTVGGCKCATVVHTGPYSELMGTYMATFEWISAKGFESAMPVFEIYENSPKEVEESNLRTKICIPVVPKGDGPKPVDS